MFNIKLSKICTYCIALVWLINGLFCKVLNFVPRHQEIVERIIPQLNSSITITIIGLSEILIAFWIVSKFKSRLCTWMQIFIVTIMNITEFLMAKDLLLWGKLNALFALLFIIVVYLNEYYLKQAKPLINNNV